MPSYGMSERELREFLEREIERTLPQRPFIGENDETEEVMDLLVDASVKVLAANNKRIERDWQKAFRDAELGVSDCSAATRHRVNPLPMAQHAEKRARCDESG
jgi:hypothetical protein